MQPSPQKQNPAGGPGSARQTTKAAAKYNGSPIEVLRARLDNIRGNRAKCPACGNRGGLSFREADNGAILLHCFACNDTPAILAAIGLTLADLYPERIRDDTPEGRRAARLAFRRSAWAAALDVLGLETKIVVIAGRQVKAAQPLNDEDERRLDAALERIDSAREVLCGR